MGHRPRSDAELRARLRQRGFDTGCVDKVLSQLREKGLADDFAFAQFWAENRESFSPRSRAMLRRELRAKGVDAETIAEVIGGIDEGASAYRAAQKRVMTISTLDYDSFRKKLLGFLERRGFGYEVGQRTVNQLWDERSKGEQNAQESSEW